MTTVNLLKYVVQNNNSDHGDTSRREFTNRVDAEIYQNELETVLTNWLDEMRAEESLYSDDNEEREDDDYNLDVTLEVYLTLPEEEDQLLEGDEITTIEALQKEFDAKNPNLRIRLESESQHGKPTAIMVGTGANCAGTTCNVIGCTWYVVDDFSESEFLMQVFSDIKAEYPFSSYQVHRRRKDEQEDQVRAVNNQHYQNFDKNVNEIQRRISKLKQELHKEMLLLEEAKKLKEADLIQVNQRIECIKSRHYYSIDRKRHCSLNDLLAS